MVTGASSGIGQALAYWYLNQGAIVILVGKDEITLKSIASQYPTQATVVVTNITDDYQCKDLVEAVKNKFIEMDNILNAAQGMRTYDQTKKRGGVPTKVGYSYQRSRNNFRWRP